MDKNNSIINKAVEIINKDGVILYPTETIWGIGCDATNSQAIKKIYSIKKRDKKKPLILLMNSTEMLSRYIKKIPICVYDIINKSTRPTTIIYENPINLPQEVIHFNTIGIRIVKNNYLVKLLEKINTPLTSSSANISGIKHELKFNNIDKKIKDKVNYIVPEHMMTNMTHEPSKILKIKNDIIEVLRQ